MSDIAAKRILVAARKKIVDRDRWIKGTFAQDAQGEECFLISDEAVKFCMLGAAFNAAYEAGRPSLKDDLASYLATAAYDLKGDTVPSSPVSNFNDHHSTTHDDVMRVYDRAIALTSGLWTRLWYSLIHGRRRDNRRDGRDGSSHL